MTGGRNSTPIDKVKKPLMTMVNEISSHSAQIGGPDLSDFKITYICTRRRVKKYFQSRLHHPKKRPLSTSHWA
jgi:hypothetical protein